MSIFTTRDGTPIYRQGDPSSNLFYVDVGMVQLSVVSRAGRQAVVAMLGPGLVQIMIAVGVTNIPIFARLLRGSILAQRENDFVLAARATGVRSRSILMSHILPNAMLPVCIRT